MHLYFKFLNGCKQSECNVAAKNSFSVAHLAVPTVDIVALIQISVTTLMVV